MTLQNAKVNFLLKSTDFLTTIKEKGAVVGRISLLVPMNMLLVGAIHVTHLKNNSIIIISFASHLMVTTYCMTRLSKTMITPSAQNREVTI
jgi:hypothetical protein